MLKIKIFFLEEIIFPERKKSRVFDRTYLKVSRNTARNTRNTGRRAKKRKASEDRRYPLAKTRSTGTRNTGRTRQRIRDVKILIQHAHGRVISHARYQRASVNLRDSDSDRRRGSPLFLAPVCP